jgi:predicted DNA-binding transcriptional regulator AlpA
MADFESLITSAVESAVKKALTETLASWSPSGHAQSHTHGDDEVLTVPALAQYLGIGQRQAYELVNGDPPPFAVKRVGTRILVLRGSVRTWLEAGGEARLPTMTRATRALLRERRRDETRAAQPSR